MNELTRSAIAFRRLVPVCFALAVGCSQAPEPDGEGPVAPREAQPEAATPEKTAEKAPPAPPPVDHAKIAREVLEATGVKGGLVVHLGCEDGKLTAALCAGDAYLVHGLDPDAANVSVARKHIRALGLYGKVTVDRLEGSALPLVDNLADLVVADDLGAVTQGEVMRVLSPGGVAFVKVQKAVKPWPDEIDEWTHYLHDPAGSCVSNDTVVGPPRRMQWVGGPRHARSHEHTASLHALVSAKGRLFDVTDLGSRASIQLPSKYTLTARDAFNGKILWRREIPDWFNHLFPLKAGPAYMPRRLVAVDDTVYVSGGMGRPMLALDAATGEVVREYDGTATTVDIILSDGVLFVVVDPERKLNDYKQESAHCWTESGRANKRWGWNAEEQTIKAVDAGTGRMLWEKRGASAPMTLAADGARVCTFDGKSVVCLDRKSGEERWKSEPVGGKASSFVTGYAPKLIIHGERVLYSPKEKIAALDAKTGKTLWSVKKKVRSGHHSPEDLFVIDGIVWAAGTARGKGSSFIGYDLETGEQKKVYPNKVKAFYMHQRCYPGRATTKWLIPAATGTEFVDPKTGEWEIHHWVRGGCLYGMMPANGLLYATPQACACYYQSKLNGFNALVAGERELPAEPAGRLVKGPAFGKVEPPAEASPESDWPVFRRDNERSGFARTDVKDELKELWAAKLSGRLSQPVAAGGRLYVSAVDGNAVHALDAATGKPVWTFTAGGRVDSPPTIYRGLALFGCADGYVYALRAADGALVWRFRAAPVDQRLVSYERLESVWPVSGSVLVQDGTLYCVAGRSMFVDGGLRMVRLKPETGELVSETVMDDKVPGTDKNLQTIMAGKHMPMSLPDVLSSDGRYVYMKSQTFDMEGKRTRVASQKPNEQFGEERHLFSPISLLDDSWFHRDYWILGRAAGEGWAEWQIPGKNAHYGRIMSFDDDTVYAYGRDPELLSNSSVLEYRLYAAEKDTGDGPKGKLARSSVNWHQMAKLPEKTLTMLKFAWKTEHPPFLVRAMVLANDTLFVAGPPDVVDEKAMWGRSNEPEFAAKMREQVEALGGSRGAVLWAVSKKDGTKLSEMKLDWLPAFDGMIASGGRLYITTADGKVVCLE
ncbi:MAG: outer membrane protein assembly factor BamB family protein [Planctomycetota bacterium]